RDTELISTGGDLGTLANVDLRPALEELGQVYQGERGTRAFSAIGQAVTAVGRVQRRVRGAFPADDPRPGDQVVVQSDSGPALATVVRSNPHLSDRRRSMADPSARVGLATLQGL